ncbi:hypothetical protein [Paracoccus onubensis]|uniref:hypothetical protein n=1 Tax=Paracoccus onubensis TaxID=1675788 RepID=UPI0015FF4137|nr:hypothetical protein [Paracoccus onubensis]
MFSTRYIINDLRTYSRTANGPVARSMLRGADELERLLDELHLLRAFAEIPVEAE